MNGQETASFVHTHHFLGTGHARAERRTWAVIALCSGMMVAEIVGGMVFGSIALEADGWHMATHAGALLLAALAYRYARRWDGDARFSFGTGKFGDLAGFASAIVLAMIAAFIGYESVLRAIAPVAIDFDEALAIAVLGLLVNVASVWLLGGHGHDHPHGHHHGHAHSHGHADEDEHRLALAQGAARLGIHEDGISARFRLCLENAPRPVSVAITTERPDGGRQSFPLVDRGAYLESTGDIPEPHEFIARVRIEADGRTSEHNIVFAEHDHAAHEHTHAASHRDNNLRAAIVHVLADAAVSVLVIIGLLLGRTLGWIWLDPMMGVVGATVIAIWSWGLLRDAGAVLLDMTPDHETAARIRKAIEASGDRVTDLHLWRLGPGHLGAILSVATQHPREPGFYRERLGGFPALSHVTVEVNRIAAPLRDAA
ncbi:CDF family Co(II)/Ni(II) efflux transporter DmeF [Rhodovastum atsumiense]|uniref:CDF family Co(II)/Ni(II) efflux transporter DmeF n=1 Tax=Rhodovastum atsumiense TaxID=504468 RepID=A0A5M6IXD7_9PROT|nr:CDF family Co(II)/Ni(II) efflux transporter DmeF [Rhodovastum atsumiense]KAA5612921.1 CDF family Co(II)/Ni(II) efflux transporter DmeF [Rhodovastum atsumiense]CAH2600995.1 CDF family Co(II)/Ni(II) efflux transporter DmeF [Rhodovastum atsumiense]